MTNILAKNRLEVGVIIPAYNEEKAVGKVVSDIPQWVKEVVVVNNGSTDKTSKVARQQGATVLKEERRGYGYACLKGIEYFKQQTDPHPLDVVVFIDGDYSDYPEEMEQLIIPIQEQDYDMVIGSRTKGEQQKGAMLPQAVFGNWVATRLLYLIYGARFSDLGPFRAIRFNKLLDLNMRDKTFGWTVEMQVKAAKQGLRFCEVPVSYRPRIGTSKVTGTLYGSVMAGIKIIYTIFRYI